MKSFESFVIAGCIILVFIGGYFAGLSESEAGKHVLKKSQWEETIILRICKYDPTCKMFVAMKK